MRQVEWLTSSDPVRMLAGHRKLTKLSVRKARLFCVACCRYVAHHMWAEASRLAMEVAERYADGEATAEEAETAYEDVFRASASVFGRYRSSWDYDVLDEPDRAMVLANTCAMDSCDSYPDADSASRSAAEIAQIDRTIHPQPELLRCIFGNPFRPVGFDPAWRTSTAVGLADAIYADRAFDRLPILADALQDAGCEDAAILGHCRGDGPHVRGCWVVDLVLGKE
jgi:hypothetical protein